MKESKYSISLFNQIIEVTLQDTGNGLVVTISGGDRGHIGAVALRDPDGSAATLIELPTHKEGVIAEKWANALAETFACPVLVSCGIHYDNITKEKINEVLKVTDEMLAEIIPN